jgi:5'-nucleotidase
MTRKLFLATAAACAFVAGPALADYSISILHTNDFHSRVEPINKYDSGCKEEDNAAGKCFGGYARMANAIRAAREAAPNSLLVDGGDQFQGSLFYTYYKGKVAAEMMNALGYDAMTVGNHEFDDGPAVLRGFMDAVKFPVLLANADITNEPELADVLKASTVIEKDGQKIGLIGVTPVDTSELASPGPNIRFSDPVPAVQAEVDKLTAAGVNKIVLLSHSGYTIDLWIGSRVSGLDVIVGGHSNTYLSNASDRAAGPYPTWRKGPDGGNVAIVQAYAYGKYLGKLDVTFDDAGNVTAASGEPIIVDGQIAEDSGLKSRIAELAQPLDEIRNKVIGSTSAPIDGDRKNCRATVCEMGVLVADAMLAKVQHQGVSIAFANGGGLRASIDDGEVTMGEVLTVLPFQNTLATFRIKGKDIVAALEAGVSQVEEGKGRFPQVAGLKFTWNRAAPPNQGRVKEVLVMKDGAWAPIDPEATYGVVSNNYVRTGGDGYVMFAENAIDPYDFGPDIADVVAEYIAASGSYKPYTDDRIVEQ